MTEFFRVVSRDIAANPIARAVERQERTKQARLFCLKCYSWSDGAPKIEEYIGAARLFAVSVRLCEQAGRDIPGVIRGAISCCQQASERKFTWRGSDAVALDTGLMAAIAVIDPATAAEMQRAWKFVMELERAEQCVPATIGAQA